MSSFEQRLVQAMRRHGIANAPQLARALGYNGSERVRLVMNGTSKPSFGMLEDIARVMADVDLHWLITGRGNPVRVNGPEPPSIPAVEAIQELGAHIQAVAGPPEWLRPILALQEQLAKVQQEVAQLKQAQKGAGAARKKAG